MDGRTASGTRRPASGRRRLAVVVGVCLLVPAGIGSGSRPADAQTTVEFGVPAACPTSPAVWSPQPGDSDFDTVPTCVLEMSVCGESRLWANQYMAPSAEYPDFCEETVNEAADRALFTQCSTEGGIAALVTGPAGSRDCRLVQIPACPAALHRVTSLHCRAVQRRPWSCPAPTVPRNEFNTCYRPPADYTTPDHPACGPGAPAFPVGGCEEYVGQDFVRSPATMACASFDTGSAATQLQPEPSNSHWCRYDGSLLDLACHGSGASCAAATALCLKRASRSGGCDAAAGAIRCRALQAGVRDNTLSPGDAIAAGCAPCIDLPFDPVPSQCPDSFHAAPRTAVHAYGVIHRVRTDFAYSHPDCQSVRSGGAMTAACSAHTVCSDPPRGRLVWESAHSSGLGIVNTPVVFAVQDTLTQQSTLALLDYRWRQPPQYALSVKTVGVMLYPEDSSPASAWARTASTGTVRSVRDLVSPGECLFEDRPQFRAAVEELWPDNPDHHQAILRLFGSGSLDWWDALSDAEKRSRTEVRGLGWWPGLSTAERAQRIEDTTQVVDCDRSDRAWCRWTPQRSGYYRAKAAGAWVTKRFGQRGWVDPFQDWNGYFDTLRDLLSTAAGRAVVTGYLSQLGLSPADAGLAPDLSDLLALPADLHEWAYNSLGTYNAACTASDLRFLCYTSGDTANYTETEYVGVVVHEIRTATVAPG